VRKSLVTVLDVARRTRFAAATCLGRSHPDQELERRLSELPKRKEIVAYCRARTA